MVIGVDRNRCSKCGVCYSRMAGYCISADSGYPIFDAALCNTCQKCVSICPHQAITVNGQMAIKITKDFVDHSESVLEFLIKRRSIKKFRDRPVEKEKIERILEAATYAPNQNKNITINVFTDKSYISEIRTANLVFITKFYNLFFRFRPVFLFIKMLYPGISTIKRKMEYSLNNRILPEHSQVVFVATGNKKVPVTERSSHYVLASMMFVAESMGIGTCLLDSVYISLRTNKRARMKLGLSEDVLGVFVAGYSAEYVQNIPRGYLVPVKWNTAEVRENILTSSST